MSHAAPLDWPAPLHDDAPLLRACRRDRRQPLAPVQPRGRATRRRGLPAIANACPKRAARSRRSQVACAGAAVSRSLRAPVPRGALLRQALPTGRIARQARARAQANLTRRRARRRQPQQATRRATRRPSADRHFFNGARQLGPLSRSTPAPLWSRSCFGRAAPPAAVPIECPPGADSVARRAAALLLNARRLRSPDSTAPFTPLIPYAPCVTAAPPPPPP